MVAGIVTALGMSLVEILRGSASTVLWKNVVFLGGGALFLVLPVFFLVIGREYHVLRTSDPAVGELGRERRAVLVRGFCWFLGAGLVLVMASFLE
jgi:hypothetical protein